MVWLHTSGEVLEPEHRVAVERWVEAGGGYAGLHGASDAEREWPFYERLVGARFRYHPSDQRQNAVLIVEDQAHPSTRAMPLRWEWEDEWYVHETNPRANNHVLLTVDESTYDCEEEAMGADHPIAWSGQVGLARTWYSALGHHAESYADPVFRAHVWGGVESVLKSAR